MKKFFLTTLFISLLFFSCKSTDFSNSGNSPDIQEPVITENDRLTLIFAGDIMAHTPNFRMDDFSKIWRDISYYTKNSDFTFGNIEAPVNDNVEWTSYPEFNMHSDYVREAVKAGFNVFTVANNHTNDYLEEGILATKKTFENLEKEYEKTSRKFYWSGLRKERYKDFSYSFIEKDNWKILYTGITQSLNRPQYASYINYLSPASSEKEKFIIWLKKIREDNPSDLFILGLHTDEPEYIQSVTQSQEKWYSEILDAGVDIIWANHAHVIKKQKLIKPENGNYEKLIMYGNGNTISAQRTAPNLDLKKTTERDDTGDGLIFKVIFEKNEKTRPFISGTERFFITTYINTSWHYVIKPLNDSFIAYCAETRPSWKDYAARRKEICEQIVTEIEEKK